MSEASDAEQLIGVLINKMETMDNNLMILKAENEALKQLINNPQRLLRKMGLVNVTTPFTNDLQIDPFRNDVNMEDNIFVKGSTSFDMLSNESIHNMTWEEIHEMANKAKGVSY